MHTIAPQVFSTGDLIALLMLVVVAGGQVVAWIVGLVKGLRGSEKMAAARATASAQESAAVNAVAGALDKIAKEFKEQNARYQSHEVECAAWRGQMGQLTQELVKTNADMARAIEGMQRQITNVALGIAPSGPVELPANTRPARGRR